VVDAASSIHGHQGLIAQAEECPIGWSPSRHREDQLTTDDGVFNGSIMNCWQAAIEDVGPGGVDKGKGGKYVFLPPDYKDTLPDGYIPMTSNTYQGYALLRSVLRSGSAEDVVKAVTYSRRIKLYPLSQAADPPPTTFADASNVVFDSTIRYDLSFFESLDKMVQIEPWLERDKAMIDPLKTIGIERGKRFEPNAKTKEILADAIKRQGPGSKPGTTSSRFSTKAGAGSFLPHRRWSRTS
jgi:hypothetical protein